MDQAINPLLGLVIVGIVLLAAVWHTPAFQEYLRERAMYDMARRTQERIERMKQRALQEAEPDELP